MPGTNRNLSIYLQYTPDQTLPFLHACMHSHARTFMGHRLTGMPGSRVVADVGGTFTVPETRSYGQLPKGDAIQPACSDDHHHSLIHQEAVTECLTCLIVLTWGLTRQTWCLVQFRPFADRVASHGGPWAAPFPSAVDTMNHGGFLQMRGRARRAFPADRPATPGVGPPACNPRGAPSTHLAF